MRSTPIFALLMSVTLGQSFYAQTSTGYIFGKPGAAHDGFALVELFTSEGCSSCPPAERLAAEIIKENAGKNVYVLAYHVDYWDRLGWKDAFSSREWSQRQSYYGDLLGLRSIYTPQVIVNGQSEFVGSDARKLRAAIEKALATSPGIALSLRGRDVLDNTVDIAYFITGDANNKQLLLALVEKTAATAVKGGENAGMRLVHVNIVRQLKSLSSVSVGSGSVKLEIPKDLNVKDCIVIGFIQNIAGGMITAAATLDPLN